MFELSDFYSYCKENNITVLPFDNAPCKGTTMRDADLYAIFLDFTKISSTRQLKGVCCHELGHVATGALHKIESPFETVERSEYRANRWSAETFLTVEDFKEAFADGYTEPWELAEYFDLPEEDITKALSYWSECKGVDFNE